MAGRCSCRFWSLCGMSCPHACRAIFEKGDNPEDYCRRPMMVRIREPDENRTQTKYRKTGTSVTCSNCGQYGHNRRLCPNPIRAALMTPPPSRPSNTLAPASQPSNSPALPSQPPHTPVPSSQSPHTPAPPSQPSNTLVPASLPTTLPTPASLPTAPASQPLPKTKIFGVRRSGRLKIGVRKAISQSHEHVDLTLD
ncbi:hypothetical protein Ahy_A05g023850 [Arachis hypogaea]|uniref:CCHC-type domain-containing protein n=1 Tax=Arachis hypogaea TaxID=3818 RepID=A0A445D4L9_ARAHY|nr:hypothetical protein Ahy_A05g023850 [Arachis hypogaea]